MKTHNQFLPNSITEILAAGTFYYCSIPAAALLARLVLRTTITTRIW